MVFSSWRLRFGVIVMAFLPLISLAKHTAPVKPVAQTVQTDKVAVADLPQTVLSLGSLSAVSKVTLSPQTDGRIANVFFKNGQQVAKGMPVVQLDDTLAQADYEKAKTGLQLAKLNYQRSARLGTFAISAQDLATLKAQVSTSQATADSAFAMLQQMKIVAPFNGVLGAFQASTGDYVSAGTALVTLVNIKQLRVDFTIPEVYSPKLKQGQLAAVTVAAYPKDKFFGTVSYISPSIDQSTHSIAMQALVQNNKGELSPGMFVHVSLQIGVLKKVLVLANEAIQADVKGYYVYKVVGNKAVQTYIKIGQRTGDKAQVLSGLKLGDEVVSAGQQKLQDGSIIKVKNS
jgi:membrane fusion protein, multidrug efflux system